jgi:uncharacterized protein with FMN-binding domain
MIHIPRRAATALAGTAVVTVLLFSFKTPAELVGATDAPSVAIVEDGGSGAGATPSPATNATPTPASNDTATPAPTDATAGGGTAGGGTADVTEVTGPTVETRFGPVQVQIEVSGGTITDVLALQLPSGGRSGRISSAAEPTLHDEALAAQSAAIDGVSGATYTSRAYEQSLQAALDQAGL